MLSPLPCSNAIDAARCYNAAAVLPGFFAMLIVGIKGTTLEPRERDWIAAPAVSGVILFTRNFVSREQVTGLIADLRELRKDPFLVTVDQEGGPVQRFREGFTRLPALARLGACYDRD